eukprot:gene7790-biopygen8820
MCPRVPEHIPAFLLDAPLLAALLWQRLRGAVPAARYGRRAVGLREELKFLRYGEGDNFAAHLDGPWVRPGTQHTSLLSVNIYRQAVNRNTVISQHDVIRSVGIEGSGTGMRVSAVHTHPKFGRTDRLT